MATNKYKTKLFPQVAGLNTELNDLYLKCLDIDEDEVISFLREYAHSKSKVGEKSSETFKAMFLCNIVAATILGKNQMFYIVKSIPQTNRMTGFIDIDMKIECL